MWKAPIRARHRLGSDWHSAETHELEREMVDSGMELRANSPSIVRLPPHSAQPGCLVPIMRVRVRMAGQSRMLPARKPSVAPDDLQPRRPVGVDAVYRARLATVVLATCAMENRRALRP